MMRATQYHKPTIWGWLKSQPFFNGHVGDGFNFFEFTRQKIPSGKLTVCYGKIHHF
jgi:hypothetical protein